MHFQLISDYRILFLYTHKSNVYVNKKKVIKIILFSIYDEDRRNLNHAVTNDCWIHRNFFRSRKKNDFNSPTSKINESLDWI